MKRIWFIRHGKHDWLGKALVGRKRGVALNDEGHQQASAIADQLRSEPLAAVYSSPQVRAIETAAPIARAHILSVRIDDALDEIDFGAWTGLTFDRLRADPAWRKWNESRADGVAPEGEAMAAVQRRILKAVERFAGRAPVALVSHGDVIRAALVSFLGLSLNEIFSVRFEPGALALVEFADLARARVTIYDPPAVAANSLVDSR